MKRSKRQGEKWRAVLAGRRERIQTLGVAQLEDLAEALLDFQSVEDLDVWLKEH